MNESIVLGGGCFWCLEAAYQLVRGVTEVTSGYAGGSVPDPNYYAVATGKTGHAEVVRVEFDPDVVSLKSLLDIFWTIHNPTTLNQQGYDKGTEYRSIILYDGDAQKQIAEQSIKEVRVLWSDPVVTEVKQLTKFYVAEPEHLNYYKTDPSRMYCQVVINPKLQKLRQKNAELLK